MSRARFAVKAAQDVSNHCPDRSCGPDRRHHDVRLRRRARADRQYFFGSAAAAAGRHSPRQSHSSNCPTMTRKCRNCRAGGVADPEPSAAGAGRSAAGKLPVAAAGAAAGTTVAPQGTQPEWPFSRRTRRSGRCQCTSRTSLSATRHNSHGSHYAGDAAAGRRGRHRAAGRRRSPTRRRSSPVSTRSPAASSSSTRISARPCSSARCG